MVRQILLSLMFSLPFAANAAIVDFGGYTRDTISGLDWLDVSTTQNLSFDQVIQEMGSGGAYEGWRYATRVELFDLLANSGLTILDPTSAYSDINPFTLPIDPAEQSIITPLINMLGVTTQSYYGPVVSGMLGDSKLIAPGDLRHPIVVIQTHSIFLPGIYLPESSGTPLDGSFLVRAVPLPASAWLFCSGLLLLVARKQRH